MCAGFAMAGVTAVVTSSPVLGLPGDLAVIIKASRLDKDPQDSQAIAAVCTVCHAASQFLATPRSSVRWQQVYDEMSGYGAIGTDDQLDRLVAAITPELRAEWAKGDAAAWAMETWAVGKASAYTFGTASGCDPAKPRAYVPYGYEQAARPVIELQLERAGVRLATVLNRALG